MTQEEKELLLKDLCARLPYGVKGKTLGSKTCTLLLVHKDGSVTADSYHCWINSKQFIPYLRPWSSMTEEEKEEERTLWDIVTKTRNDLHYLYTDFLVSHHFDYRGLIEKGLALEAPEGMYNV